MRVTGDGGCSYGIYLWHLPIVAWLAGKHLFVTQYLGISIGLTLLAAHLSCRLVERPLMRHAAALHHTRLSTHDTNSLFTAEARRQRTESAA